MDDPGLARRLGAAARRRVLRHYTWRHNVGMIMELYRRMGATNAVDPPEEQDA